MWPRNWRYEKTFYSVSDGKCTQLYEASKAARAHGHHAGVCPAEFKKFEAAKFTIAK
eukprot:CAMPEP_0114549372 /NCGR_PEP_ID=MMETSP0114-20121206/5493_1 /TAXON_ID=31324 /ORGANISM="Goniomonas sp, Strain m" /LENGTH=56 /DNA_ID=CAMNT_0001734051 /DNA_START=191 /DNA_END=361 /DNA_ORIENTATION=+